MVGDLHLAVRATEDRYLGCRSWPGHFRARLRDGVRILLLPATEREGLFALTEAGEVEAAVFATPLIGAEIGLQPGPAGGSVGFSCPAVEIKAITLRAARPAEIFREDGARDETGFAILAAQRRDKKIGTDLF